jgi:hypothetical protein
MPDLMERLTAADPLPHAERLSAEEQREADGLLTRLLATPVAEQPARGARMGRPLRAALAVACAAVAVLVATIVLDSDSPGPDIVELAVAAMSDETAVYHVVERNRLIGMVRDPDAERLAFHESWHTTGGRVHLKTFAADGSRRGRLLYELAGRRAPGRRGGPTLAWDARSNRIVRMGFAYNPRGIPLVDPYTDPGARLRDLEAEGRLRAAGTETVAGTDAYRLDSGWVKGITRRTRARVVFLVDPETYLPLAARFKHGLIGGEELTVATRYLVYERLPLNTRTRGLLDLDPHPGATCVAGADEPQPRGPLGFPNPCAR